MALAPTIKKEQPVVEEPEVAPVKEPTPVVQELTLTAADFIPCNWSLTSEGGDLISGVNLSTGRHFSGTMVEFNNFMKGA